MIQFPIHPDSTTESKAGTRINALLDAALAEMFPASNSGAIGTRIAVIKDESREAAALDRSTR